ncbi:hypothetical protein CPHO_04890 [Corynebacterium phocae]|uniref:DoxX family protein n=1 Tax=Corynebacterium phocae TaxID=161895 RepID=A0A1L7D2L5_9CORY|nr:hypothetical protein [Corynebacterium phocae]APT92335.1 hypothetical protein CPHO_04890 [Corynebacterium phocae]KAA8724926.1 hypothetical protein F4V58_04420 [Corynebacterium phocae]
MKSRYVLACALAAMGALHFAKPDPFESIVPPQLPGGPRLYNFASGAWELATAGLLARENTAAAGGVSACALFLAVWPANIYHAIKDWPKAWGYHLLRQPAQLWLISLAARIART